MKIALIAHDRKTLMIKLATAYKHILENMNCMQQERQA